MATQAVLNETGRPSGIRKSSIWHSKGTHSIDLLIRRSQERLDRSIEVVTICEDPRHWKAMVTKAMAGHRPAFSMMLKEFEYCLEQYFGRLMTYDDALFAVEGALRTIAKKLNTCDPRRPIMPWLLAIAQYRAAHPLSRAALH